MHATTATTNSRLPIVATSLGTAGLIPFLGLPWMVAVDEQYSEFWSRALAIYSFGIISFLLGAWWGMALVRHFRLVLILSNALFLMLLFGFLILDPPYYLMLAATMFLAILLTERHHPLFSPQPDYYRRLRAALSVAASLSLLITTALLSQQH